MGSRTTEQAVRLVNGWRDQSTTSGLILESWGQGVLIGSLLIMACITIAAMKKYVLLHKLILIEQVLAMFSGTYCFMSFNGYGWYVASTAALLYSSYFLHNIVAWMKVHPFFVSRQPFFSPKAGRLIQWTYYASLSLTLPVLIFQIFNDYRFNIGTSNLYSRIRPYEFIMGDPWWIFTNAMLLHVISHTYGISIFHLIHISPRLGILLAAILLSICFTIIDLVATILKGRLSGPVDGINPYWKFSLVCKCLTDAIMLDDFATELKRIASKDKLTSSNRLHDDAEGHRIGWQAMQSYEPVHSYRKKSDSEDIGRAMAQNSGVSKLNRVYVPGDDRGIVCEIERI